MLRARSDTAIIGGIVGGVIAAMVVSVAVVLVFYRRHRRKIASVERKMSEFGLDYPPRPEPFLVAALPRPLSSISACPSRIFYVERRPVFKFRGP